MFDGLVIGGGFYGALVATYLATRRGLRRVALMERDAGLMRRASFNNQARVHNGYHYPRSFTTAYRSRVNAPRFASDFAPAIRRDFTHVYAIARRNSKVTGAQFLRYCREIGAPLEPVPAQIRSQFDMRLIESLFAVQEWVFDASVLRSLALRDLEECGVEMHFGTRVTCLRKAEAGVGVEALAGSDVREYVARHVFNCTYSGLNQIRRDASSATPELKHEITELALIRMPSELAAIGITVMDGPFFSTLPFPPKGLNTLSHVRYTPHLSWSDRQGVDPYERLEAYAKEPREGRMLRDASRYVPAMARAEYVESVFEVKTVLAKNESDDGRPILFEAHPELGSCLSILGGKIDNLYDVLERLEAIPL